MRKIFCFILLFVFIEFSYCEKVEIFQKHVGKLTNYRQTSIFFARNEYDFAYIWLKHSPNFKIKKIDFSKYDAIFLFAGKSDIKRKFRILNIEKEFNKTYLKILCDEKFIKDTTFKKEEINLDELFSEEEYDIKKLKDAKYSADLVVGNIDKILAKKEVDLDEAFFKSRNFDKSKTYPYIIYVFEKVDNSLVIQGLNDIFENDYVTIKEFEKDYKKMSTYEFSKYFNEFEKIDISNVYSNTKEFDYVHSNDMIDNGVLEYRNEIMEKKKKVLEMVKKKKDEEEKAKNRVVLSEYDKYRKMLVSGNMDEYLLTTPVNTFEVMSSEERKKYDEKQKAIENKKRFEKMKREKKYGNIDF